MRNYLSAVVIAFASLACMGAETSERSIDELMRKSGLWEQVGQMQAQMRAGAEGARAQDKAAGRGGEMSDAEHARLVVAMNAVFAPDRMRAAVSRELAAVFSVEDEKEVLVWLSTDLGQRFTRIEEEQGDVERYKKTEREAPEFLKTVPKSRLDKFTRLGESMQVGESSASLLINLMIATAYGAVSAMPGGADESVYRALRRRFEAQRKQIAAAMTQQSIATWAYIYQGVGDDEIERYVAFAETPAGRRYHDATMKVLDKVLVQATLELGSHIGALTAKERERRS